MKRKSSTCWPAGFNLYTISILAAGLVCAGLAPNFRVMFSSPELGRMLPFIPLLIALNIFRNVGIRYLQIDLRINAIFWVDLAFFGSILILAVLANALGLFHTAADFMYLNMIGGALSSIVAWFFCSRAFWNMPLLSVPRHEYSKMFSFAKFQAGTSALLTLQQWADVLIVGFFYSPAEVAIYSAAKTIYRFSMRSRRRNAAYRANDLPALFASRFLEVCRTFSKNSCSAGLQYWFQCRSFLR